MANDNGTRPRTQVAVATERTADEMATAIFIAHQRRNLPGTVGILLTALALWLRTGIGPWALLLPGALAVLSIVLWQRTRQQTQAVAPPGAALQTTFSPTMLVLETSTGRAAFRLASISRVRVIGDYVVFRAHRAQFACPKEIFPVEQVELLRRG